jgi:hypothetical protein
MLHGSSERGIGGKLCTRHSASSRRGAALRLEEHHLGQDRQDDADRVDADQDDADPSAQAELVEVEREVEGEGDRDQGRDGVLDGAGGDDDVGGVVGPHHDGLEEPGHPEGQQDVHGVGAQRVGHPHRALACNSTNRVILAGPGARLTSSRHDGDGDCFGETAPGCQKC